VSINNSMKAHRIVQASFDMSGTVGGSTVKVTDTDRNRLGTTFEIWSYGSSKYTELILISRFNTDNGIASEHIRTYI